MLEAWTDYSGTNKPRKIHFCFLSIRTEYNRADNIPFSFGTWIKFSLFRIKKIVRTVIFYSIQKETYFPSTQLLVISAGDRTRLHTPYIQHFYLRTERGCWMAHLSNIRGKQLSKENAKKIRMVHAWPNQGSFKLGKYLIQKLGSSHHMIKGTTSLEGVTFLFTDRFW